MAQHCMNCQLVIARTINKTIEHNNDGTRPRMGMSAPIYGYLREGQEDNCKYCGGSNWETIGNSNDWDAGTRGRKQR